MKYDRAAIAEMSLSELVAAYNALTGEKVKKFADRKAGVRRVLAALDRSPALGAAERAPEPPPAPPPASTGRPESKPKKPRKPYPRQPLVVAANPDGKITHWTSKRVQLIVALRSPGGIAGEDAMKRFGWTRRDLMDALRLAAKRNGVAVREENGRFYGSGGAPSPADEVPASTRKPAAADAKRRKKKSRS